MNSLSLGSAGSSSVGVPQELLRADLRHGAPEGGGRELVHVMTTKLLERDLLQGHSREVGANTSMRCHCANKGYE